MTDKVWIHVDLYKCSLSCYTLDYYKLRDKIIDKITIKEKNKTKDNETLCNGVKRIGSKDIFISIENLFNCIMEVNTPQPKPSDNTEWMTFIYSFNLLTDHIISKGTVSMIEKYIGSFIPDDDFDAGLNLIRGYFVDVFDDGDKRKMQILVKKYLELVKLRDDADFTPDDIFEVLYLCSRSDDDFAVNIVNDAFFDYNLLKKSHLFKENGDLYIYETILNDNAKLLKYFISKIPKFDFTRHFLFAVLQNKLDMADIILKSIPNSYVIKINATNITLHEDLLRYDGPPSYDNYHSFDCIQQGIFNYESILYLMELHCLGKFEVPPYLISYMFLRAAEHNNQESFDALAEYFPYILSTIGEFRFNQFEKYVDDDDRILGRKFLEYPGQEYYLKCYKEECARQKAFYRHLEKTKVKVKAKPKIKSKPKTKTKPKKSGSKKSGHRK